MANQVTASRVALLLECTRPFDPAIEHDEREETEAMRYGSCVHEILEGFAKGGPALPPEMQKVAKRWNVELDVEHPLTAWKALQKWMTKKGNPYGESFEIIGTEQSLKMARIGVPCAFDKESHTYGLEPGEWGGTYDLLLQSAQRKVVLDTKTGNWGNFTRPAAMAQMLALALLTDADAVAILHTPRDAAPVIYCEDVSTMQLAGFEGRLDMARERIGDGSMRPGDHCLRCPARGSCPTQDSNLLRQSGALIKAANTTLERGPVEPGAMHMFLQEFDRLAKRAREELRDLVRSGAVVERPDGKVLEMRRVEYETLSKTSVVAGLGKQKGEAMLDKLRKLGCVKSGEREELRAVGEK